MKVREAIEQKKPLYRLTIIVAGNLTYLLSDKVDVVNGFLHITTDDFKYVVNPVRDGKKTVANVHGDYSQESKYVNVDCIAAYEDIYEGEPRYEHFKDMIDRCIAAKCNIQLPPEKSIVIANG